MDNLKTVRTSGADENTPSHAQYFSWINNTNEGSTEKQTKINLNFFRYLREKYGMQLDIYAWDAGNLDGANGTYENFKSEKLKKQYPNGYAPVVEAARQIGVRMGVWGGADGFGDTKEEADARHEMIVSLCRDYNFALFKFDTACGFLRKDKRENFAEMIRECRRYCPDLVVLNHRNELGEAEIYATTFLWGGVETYVDVHIANDCTAPHHRAFLFHRGSVPGLRRLTEDHGVCISSCVDRFDDDLIYQAFNRCLILAPEIYGNPWLLRDSEYAMLARIYNLHRRHRDILVNGMQLPESYGSNAVSRGNDSRRFICTGNDTWQTRNIEIRLDGEIGLEPCGEVACIRRFPTEKTLGVFPYGSVISVEALPFRALLLEVCDASQADALITGCEYIVEHETDGRIDKVKLLSSSGTAVIQDGGDSKTIYQGEPFDNTPRAPIFLGRAEKTDVPANAEALYEATCFALDNNSLEKRSLIRSGPTEIPEVQAARDAFFGQTRYRLRGCDDTALFDGNPDTLFDAHSRTAFGGLRVEGGCLRVDFGSVLDADRVELTYFEADETDCNQFLPQNPQSAEASSDLLNWTAAELVQIRTEERYELPTVIDTVHNIEVFSGVKKTAVYSLSSPTRYFRLDSPIDRIFSVKVFCGTREQTLFAPHATNLMAPYRKKQPVGARRITVSLGDISPDSYLAVALEGVHGIEGAYCAAEFKGMLLGCPDRAPSYPSNIWECCVRQVDRFYTYYLPLTPEMAHNTLDITVLFCDAEHPDTPVDVWLCEKEHI